MRWAPGLSALLGLPFDRRETEGRIARILERYQLLLELARTPPAGRRRPTLKLLQQHPTALLEGERIGPSALEARHQAVQRTRRDLDEAAPPAGSLERARVLALADAEVFLLHLKALDRLARRSDPARASVAVAKLPWLPPLPLDPAVAEGLCRAFQATPKAERHRSVLGLAGLRHQAPEFVEWLLPALTPLGDQSFISVGPASAIKDGQAKRYDVHGATVAVFRQGERLYALDDVCPHRGGPLGKGELEDGCVLCPLHGWAFELETGCLRGSPSVRVPTYELQVTEGELAIGPPKRRS